MNIYEIVGKLIGEIYPVGETYTDDERYENLKAMCDLTSDLIIKIGAVARNNKDRGEYSMARAGKHADEFLKDLQE